MSNESATKQKLDEFRASLPVGDEHTEPTREMLRVTSFACNGAPDKVQAIADAVGSIALFLATVHKGESKRISDIVDAALDDHVKACSLKLVSDRSQPAAFPAPEDKRGVWSQAWVFVNANSKTLIYSLTVVLIVAILKGELQTLLDAIPKRQQAMMQYEPSASNN